MSRLKWLWNDLKKTLANEVGGGGDPQPPQIISPPNPPDIGKNAEESYQAQLKYNEPLAQNALTIQQNLGPQFAQAQYQQTSQMAPLYRALLESQYPQINQLSGQVSQQLQSPTGYNPQQQAAVDAIRNREQNRGLRGIREGANLGGTLYGSNREQRESDYLTQQGQAYSQQDIGMQQQQRGQTLQELLSLFQIAGLPVQQVNNTPQLGQSVVPGADNLYSALVSNNSNFGVLPGGSGKPNPLTMFYDPRTYGF